MALSRRQLLRGLGTSIVGTSLAPSIADATASAIAGASWSAGEVGRSREPIRLHRNENPFGASRAVVAAMQKAVITAANRYANEATDQLRSAIAARHRVPTDHIVLGSGSSAILRAAANAQWRSTGKIVMASPTFEWLTKHVQRTGAKTVAVPLTKSYEHDLDGMLAGIGPGPALVYICNPHNPTGTTTRPQDLERFVRRLPPTARVIIDEAYHHYMGPSADYASWLDRSVPDPRVIVTRTFSKIHGLAGLRIGYAVAAPGTARLLRLRELEDGMSVVSARAALIALNDDEHIRASMARNVDDRQEFFNEANTRMLRVIDSQTNFVMLKTVGPASHVVEHLRKHNILVPVAFPGFEQYIRVSLGTREDMHAFWGAWDLLPGGGHGHKTSM
jgi:histidinol-phosphate aminotransferase